MRSLTRTGALVLTGFVCATELGCGRIGFELLSDSGPVGGGEGSGGSAITGVGGSAAGGTVGNIDASAIGQGGVANPGRGGAPSGTGGTSIPNTGGASSSGGAGGTAGATGGTAGVAGSAGGATGGAGGSTGGVSGTGGAVDGGVLPGVEKHVASGFALTCGVGGTGKLSCWGVNTSMALGGAGGARSSSPVPVGSPAAAGGFVEIAAGEAFACGRRNDGRVWCWGDNTRGTRATGDTSVTAGLSEVTFSSRVVQISTKSHVACALLSDGTLYCWGDNAEGQAGQNEPPPYTDALTPLRVPLPGFVFVSTGQGHVCGVRSPGSLWCWGRNVMGELGQGSNVPDQSRAPLRVGTDQDWRMVSSGAFQTCAIRNDDSLWCWGDNSASQLGLGDTNVRFSPTRVGTGNDWMTVSVHVFHVCGIRRPGTLWCWGRNDEGEVGLPYSPSPTPVPTRIGSAADWVEVSNGWMHTCAMRAGGTFWCTGENSNGEVGDGTMTRPYAFVQSRPLP